ncbi:relaxase/mobilization nuclease domain-containing protein [Lachnospiraceae bacterium 45-W7]
MILTKKQYQKTGGYIAWHGYQSFKPDEVTPEQCHKIGLKLAGEMWGDKYQIIVATHLDRGHLHNHFCFNSVSYLDRKKYNYSKSEQKRLREVSDRLCREYGLSVIENPKKAPPRPLYLDGKSGKPTRYNVYLEDLTEAISGSRDIPHMMKYLTDKWYEVDFSGSHWKMKLTQYKHFTRLDTLDGRLTPDFIRSHLGTRARYGNYKARISYSPHMPEEYKNAWKPRYYWCYQLGIFPKGTDYKPTSPLMKEELRKLDEITAQVRYMSKHNISTLSDLHADRDRNQAEMDRLTDYRRHLQNKIRRASPAEKETLRAEKNGITEQITDLRKRLKYAAAIEKRSAHIDDCLNQIHDTIENQRSNQQQQTIKTDRRREESLR